MKNSKHLFLNTLCLAIIIMTYIWEAMANTITYYLTFLIGGFLFGAILGVIGLTLILLASFLGGNHFRDM